MKLRGKPEYELGRKRLLLSLTSDSEQMYCRTCKVKTNLAASSKDTSLMLSSKAETFHILGTYQVVADIFRANPFGWPPEAFIIFIDGQYGLGSLPLGYVDSRFARV